MTESEVAERCKYLKELINHAYYEKEALTNLIDTIRIHSVSGINEVYLVENLEHLNITMSTAKCELEQLRSQCVHKYEYSPCIEVCRICGHVQY